MIARQARHIAPASLLFIEVDGLKWPNASFGHTAGDAALIFLRLSRKNPGDMQARARLEEALRAKTQKRKGP